MRRKRGKEGVMEERGEEMSKVKEEKKKKRRERRGQLRSEKCKG